VNAPRAGRGLTALLVLLTAGYPLLVYFLLGHGSARMAGLVLLAILAIRFIGPGSSRGRTLAALGAGLILVVAIALSDSETLVRLYPVGVNAALLGAFGLSLWRPPTMIERIARAQGTELDPAGVRYTRNLTAIWCVFFLLNAGAALYTALAGSREAWAAYNGLVSYVIVGALLLGERLIRPVLRRRQSGVAGR
jgi:uncharacterized membrane protein